MEGRGIESHSGQRSYKKGTVLGELSRVVLLCFVYQESGLGINNPCKTFLQPNVQLVNVYSS